MGGEEVIIIIIIIIRMKRIEGAENLAFDFIMLHFRE